MAYGESSIPVSTWLIAGTAVIVAGFTLSLLFAGKTKKADAVAEAPLEASASASKKADLAPVHPLNITRKLLDAKGRAGVWTTTAALTGARGIIENDRLSGPLTIEYGRKSGGTAVGTDRLLLAYDGDAVSETTATSKSLGVALPDPGCPLDIAFHKLNASGQDLHGPVAVVYAHSPKHGRGIWAFSEANGRSVTLDAETCSMLIR